MDVIETDVDAENVIYCKILRMYDKKALMGMREFALTEFVHVSYGENSIITTKYYYDVLQRVLHCEITTKMRKAPQLMIITFVAKESLRDDRLCDFDKIHTRGLINGKEVKSTEDKIPSTNDIKLYDNIVMQFFMLNTYMLNHLPEAIVEEREETERVVASKKHGKIKYRNEVKLIKRISLRTGDTASGNHNTITCPAWNVRGHYRQLKSGRCVYVHPYVKGKDRKHAEKIVDKTYHVKEETKHD